MHGGSPDITLNHTISEIKLKSYDFVYCIVDTDRDEWNKELFIKANKNNIKLIGLEPVCLEGFLLKTINETKVPNKADACKSKLKRKLQTDLLSKHIFKTHFPKQLLQKQRRILPILNELINLFEVS